MYQARYFKNSYFDAIEIIRPVAEKHNLTLLEVALRWIMHHSGLDYKGGDGVIIGCSSLAQLESNLKDFEKGPLPEEVTAALDVSLIPCFDGALMSSKPGRLSSLLFRITGMLPGILRLLMDAENLLRYYAFLYLSYLYLSLYLLDL